MEAVKLRISSLTTRIANNKFFKLLGCKCGDRFCSIKERDNFEKKNLIPVSMFTVQRILDLKID